MNNCFAQQNILHGSSKTFALHVIFHIICLGDMIVTRLEQVVSTVSSFYREHYQNVSSELSTARCTLGVRVGAVLHSAE